MIGSATVAICIFLGGFVTGRVSSRTTVPSDEAQQQVTTATSLKAQKELFHPPPPSTGKVGGDAELADGRNPIPKLSQLSPKALAKLKLNCLAVDLTIDPLLAELANLQLAEVKKLESAISAHQREWTEAEARRCLTIDDDPTTPKVIVPPQSEGAAQAEAKLKDQLMSIVGKERIGIVWEALAQGMRQATGDFGRIPRMITFERNAHGDEPYRVKVSTFAIHVEPLTDWAKLATCPAARMSSYSFAVLPPQFAPFVEK